MGEGVTEFQVGDHVLTLFTGECMRCRPCVSGKTNICHTLGLERQGVMHSDKKTRFSINGKPVYHYCAVSSFSEYTVVHSGCAVKITPIAPLEKICLLSCGVAAGTYLTSFPSIITYSLIFALQLVISIPFPLLLVIVLLLASLCGIFCFHLEHNCYSTCCFRCTT